MNVIELMNSDLSMIDNSLVGIETSKDKENIAIAHILAGSREEKQMIGKLFCHLPKLYKALKAIEKDSAFLDRGVNKTGDKQISRLWEIASRNINEVEKDFPEL